MDSTLEHADVWDGIAEFECQREHPAPEIRAFGVLRSGRQTRPH